MLTAGLVRQTCRSKAFLKTVPNLGSKCSISLFLWLKWGLLFSSQLTRALLHSCSTTPLQTEHVLHPKCSWLAYPPGSEVDILFWHLEQASELHKLEHGFKVYASVHHSWVMFWPHLLGALLFMLIIHEQETQKTNRLLCTKRNPCVGCFKERTLILKCTCQQCTPQVQRSVYLGGLLSFSIFHIAKKVLAEHLCHENMASTSQLWSRQGNKVYITC